MDIETLGRQFAALKEHVGMLEGELFADKERIVELEREVGLLLRTKRRMLGALTADDEAHADLRSLIGASERHAVMTVSEIDDVEYGWAIDRVLKLLLPRPEGMTAYQIRRHFDVRKHPAVERALAHAVLVRTLVVERIVGEKGGRPKEVYRVTPEAAT